MLHRHFHPCTPTCLDLLSGLACLSQGNVTLAPNCCALPTCLCRVEIDLGGGGDERQDKRLLTKLSPAAVTATLRYMQEFVSEPWSLKTDSVQTWVGWGSWDPASACLPACFCLPASSLTSAVDFSW